MSTGRRAGKTTLAARASVRFAAQGRKVLYSAPILDQTDAYWDKVIEWMGDGIRVGAIYKNETKRLLRFHHSGGRIIAKTAFKPDHLRGDYADFYISDEHAYQDPDVWAKVVAPMLVDNDGDALFISSPNRRNHFYTLAMQAEMDETGRWAYFTFPSTANPHLSPVALAELTKDMTDEDYRQEILAEFLPGEGTVFRLVVEDFTSPLPWPSLASSHRGHRTVMGIDWGQKSDYTAISHGCATCSQELSLDHFRGMDYPAQRDIIAAAYRKTKKADMHIEILAEENSMGLPNIQQMQNDGIPVTGFTMSHTSKNQLVSALRLAFEQRSWKWVQHEVGWRELEAFERKVTIQGNITYSAPDPLHDDTVIARLLMLQQAIGGHFSMA